MGALRLYNHLFSHPFLEIFNYVYCFGRQSRPEVTRKELPSR